MRKARFIVSVSSVLTIVGGALLLAPRPAAADDLGCSTAQMKAAVSDLGEICSGGGSGTINCYSDGSWDWQSVSCN